MGISYLPAKRRGGAGLAADTLPRMRRRDEEALARFGWACVAVLLPVGLVSMIPVVGKVLAIILLVVILAAVAFVKLSKNK